MRILVTGGCGFIGSNFVRTIVETRPGDFVLNLDALSYAGNLATLADVADTVSQDRYAFVHGDITDGALVDRLLREHRIEAIVNFAAESHVDRSILGPESFVRTNLVGTATLLESGRNAKLARFVQVSTDEVYGSLSPSDPSFTEQTPLSPNSPYSASKAGADLLARSYFHTFGFPALITRCSNNYGPYQFPEKLIPLMILNAMADKELPVYGQGQNVRDWIHVQDHVEAILAVLDRGKDGETYNIGANNERANLRIVETLLAAIGKPKSLIRFVTDRPGHDFRYAIDSTKIETELGWRPRVDFDDGLRRTIAWYQTRRDWWEPILSGEYLHFYDRQYGRRLHQAGGGAAE